MRSSFLILFVLLSLSGARILAQPAAAPTVPVAPAPGTYTFFGTGCGVEGYPQTYSRLRVSGRPVLGGTVRITSYIPDPPLMWRGWGQQVILTGLSATHIGSIPLPVGFDRLGLFIFRTGCLLYTSAELVTSVARDFYIPNDPSLLGLTLYQQALVPLWNDQFMVGWWQASNGGAMTIGLP